MDLPLIIQAILVLAYIGVFIYQFNAIKILNHKFDSLERFQKIFDLDKVEEYVKILEKNANLDKEIFKKEIVSEEAKKYFKKQSEQINPLVASRLTEALFFICDFLEETEDPQSADTVLSLLPENRVLLERMMADRNTKNSLSGNSDPENQSHTQA